MSDTISRLRRVFHQACDEVGTKAGEADKQELGRISRQLCNGIHETNIRHICQLYAEFSVNPVNADLLGGAADQWTFRPGGDVEVSFPLQLAPDTHESQVQLRDTRGNGSFRLRIEPNGSESELAHLGRMRKLQRYQHMIMLSMLAVPVTQFMLTLILGGTYSSTFRDLAWQSVYLLLVEAIVSLTDRMPGIFGLIIFLPLRVLSAIGFVRLSAVSNRRYSASSSEQLRVPIKIKSSHVEAIPFVPAPSGVATLLDEWRDRHHERFEHMLGLELGMAMFDCDEQLWQLSLTEFESQWIRKLRKEQGLVLSLASHLANEIVPTKGMMPTHLIKMSFFWFVYFSSDTNWSSSDVCVNALKLLRFLKMCCETDVGLPNYFYLKENVLMRLNRSSPDYAQGLQFSAQQVCSLADELKRATSNRMHCAESFLEEMCRIKIWERNPWRSADYLSSRLHHESMQTVTRMAKVTMLYTILMCTFAVSNDIMTLGRKFLLSVVTLYNLASLIMSVVSWVSIYSSLIFGWQIVTFFMWIMKKINQRNNREYRPINLVDLMPRTLTEVRQDVKAVVGDNLGNLQLLSQRFGDEFGQDARPPFDRQDNTRFAFRVSQGVLAREVLATGRFDMTCSAPVRVSERLAFLRRGIWFELAFAICGATLVPWVFKGCLDADDLLVLRLTPVLVLLLPRMCDYYGAKKWLTRTRYFIRVAQRLQQFLPNCLSWLVPCLIGDVQLRIRTGQSPVHVFAMTDVWNLRWRRCCYLLEAEKLSNLSPAQALCYSLVLRLGKKLGASQSNLEPLRMAFYWATDEAQELQWTIDNALYNALIVLELCRRCYGRASLPNYFYYAENVARVNAETFYGLPKCQSILDHMLLTGENQMNFELVQSLQSEVEPRPLVGSNAAGWSCGILGARFRILATDFCLRYSLFVSLFVALGHALS